MKKAVIGGAVLLALGMNLILGGLAVMGFDFSKLLNTTYTTHTYTPDADFDSISITCVTCDVRIAKSEDDTCKVVCTVDDRFEPTVKTESGILQIHIDDLRKWWQHIGFNWGSNTVTVYLPDSTYNSLDTKTTTGDIDVEGNQSFTKVMLNATTGDIRVSGLFCKDFSATVSTGDMKLQDVLGGRVTLKGTTGTIVLTHCDGSEIDISLSTGDVKGSLRSGKQFFARATTGEVKVPADSGSEYCRISTTTGNIEITVD